MTAPKVVWINENGQTYSKSPGHERTRHRKVAYVRADLVKGYCYCQPIDTGFFVCPLCAHLTPKTQEAEG